LLSDSFLPQGSAVAVPYVEMTASLIAFTIPLGVGLLIRRFKPKVARFLSERMMKPFSFLCIFVMLVVTE
jgi:predicted Na+-dependent transporter